MKQGLKIDQRYEIVKNLGGGLSGEVMLIKDDDELKALKFLKKGALGPFCILGLTYFFWSIYWKNKPQKIGETSKSYLG